MMVLGSKGMIPRISPHFVLTYLRADRSKAETKTLISSYDVGVKSMIPRTLNVRWTFGSADRSEAETKTMQLDASIHCRPIDPGITLCIMTQAYGQIHLNTVKQYQAFTAPPKGTVTRLCVIASSAFFAAPKT